ncbi:MAG: SlyX protein [Cycloclasticus sp. symbiont of Poecilosclerida sp. M]|nr:MAG: SlyX protein [Cycloclasticus sp. symbiont of Poecilosclerida sp. M]
MDERITNLEVKVAFQEDTISQLDAVVCEQQRDIDTLKKQVRHLLERTLELSDQAKSNTGTFSNEIPPHY